MKKKKTADLRPTVAELRKLGVRVDPDLARSFDNVRLVGLVLEEARTGEVRMYATLRTTENDQ